MARVSPPEEGWHEERDRTAAAARTDLTHVKVNGGCAYSGLVDWDEDRSPAVGEHVLVAGGGTGPLEPAITESALTER